MTQPSASAPDTPAEPVYRLRWIVLLLGLIIVLLIGSLIIQRIGQSQDAIPALPPTVTALRSVELADLGLTLPVPGNWGAPAGIDAHSIVVSPDGSADTSGPGPFLYIVVDALPVFSQRLTFRADLDDPAAQLDALIEALNRNRARFEAAQPYPGANYPAARVIGYEQGRQLTITLLKGPDGRWIYVGAQAPEVHYPYYEAQVFGPAIKSMMLR